MKSKAKSIPLALTLALTGSVLVAPDFARAEARDNVVCKTVEGPVVSALIAGANPIGKIRLGPTSVNVATGTLEYDRLPISEGGEYYKIRGVDPSGASIDLSVDVTGEEDSGTALLKTPGHGAQRFTILGKSCTVTEIPL